MSEQPKPRPPMPRKKFKSEYALQVKPLTEKSVYEDARTLVSTKVIAAKYDTTETKLKKKFARSLRLGRAVGESEVAVTLHRAATGKRPNTRAAIYIGQAQLGWVRPSAAQGVAGLEGAPWNQYAINVAPGESKPVMVVERPLSPEEFERRSRLHHQGIAEMMRGPGFTVPKDDEPPPQKHEPATVATLLRQASDPDLEPVPGWPGRFRLKMNPNLKKGR